MAKFRNGSNESVLDAHTMRQAKPDEVIEVPDEWASAYENHPVWQAVPDYKPKKAPAEVTGRDGTEKTEEVAP